MAFSIAPREKLCGGSLSGRITPVACHGPCCCGSLLPSGSPAKAQSSLLASDLNMKIRIVSTFHQTAGRRQYTGSNLAPPELLPRGRTAHRRSALVLVAEYEPALLQVVGRHLDGDTIARQRLDAVLFHLARGVGDDHVAAVELNAIARVRQDFGDEALELEQLFFRHGLLRGDGQGRRRRARLR